MTRSKHSHKGLRNRPRSKCCKIECSPKKGKRKHEHHCLICCDLAIHFPKKQDIHTILQAIS